MSLTRAQITEILSKAGVPADNMDSASKEILAGHTASVDALKEKITNLEDANKTAETTKTELEKAKKDLKTAQDALKAAEPYKEQYENEHKAFEAFKADATAKEGKAKADTALTKLLTEQGYSATGIAKIVKYGGLTPEFDDKGNITNTDVIMQSVSSEWGEYHNSPVKTEGVQTAQPPATKSSGMTKKEIRAIKDPAERLKAWKANPELLGLSNKE